MQIFRRVGLVVVGTAVLAACSSDPAAAVTDQCQYVAVPFAGSANAPRITSVVLEVQTTVIAAAATATDPQGSANVRNVLQSLSVYRNARCEGTPILLRDDLAESGQEETFGTAVDQARDPALYALIAAASTWPVMLEFVDRDGNRTTGQFRATVVH